MSTAIRDQLRTLSFVEGLTDTALHQLSHLLQPAEYACDQLLYSQGDERKIMAIGFVAAFVAAFLCVRWLIRYVSRHDFVPFAWYRIAFGLVIVLTAWSGAVQWS